MPNDNVYKGKSIIITPSRGGSASADSASTLAEPGALVVFLSSTIGDLENYRKDIQESLQTAEVVCFCSEHWINEFGPVVETCKKRLEQANAFIGIFGDWYGSIPKGYEVSITHLEFTWALKRWPSTKTSRMAILMPKDPSAAKKKLKASADLLIPKSELSPDRHLQLLTAFHKEVTDSGNTVTKFRHIKELCSQVVAITSKWRWVPLDAARGLLDVEDRSAPGEAVSEEEWGLLGRADHIAAFEKILNRAALHSEVPAIALVVHGDEDSGQRVFFRKLLENPKLQTGRPTEFGRPQFEQYEVKGLTQWVGGRLPKSKEISSPADLAEVIHTELQQHQVSFILDEVYRLSGGIMTWCKEFWNPLYSRLSELRKQSAAQTQHRLVFIVIDYDDQSTLDASVISKPTPNPSAEEYERLWLLPKLDHFDAGDLADWFNELHVPDDAGRHARLVAIALNKAKGEEDGTPLRVFERLKKVSLR